MKNKIIVISVFCLSGLSSCNHPSANGQLKMTDSISNKQKVNNTAGTNSKLTGKSKQLTDLANFIAGLPVDSSSNMYKFSLSPAWRTYNEESTLAWEKFKNLSNKIINWRDKELPSSKQKIETLFYPFGGPDYLFANLYFPNARNYILFGLENPGSVPQIDFSNKDSLSYILNLYKKALEDVIQLGFFKTVDMKTDLKNKAIDGTAPIIILFLARSGKQIIDVNPMNINDNGQIVPVTGTKKYCGIQIDFRNPGDTGLCHVYYFSTNLADPSLSANKPVFSYLKNLDPKSISMLKSASYLMHKSYFSIIRNTVLNKSIMILQDDSGISYKFFDHSIWDITLFGSYTKPVPMFINHYEADLFEAYKNVSNPIDFRYGYNTKSDILLAKKKQ